MADTFSKKFGIWEAYRATSAATTFFDPLTFSNGSMSWEFIDDALQYNNPVDNVFSEAQEILGTARPKLLLSIGTGNAPGDEFKNNLSTVVKKLKELATETERTADDFYRTHQRLFN